MNETIEMILHVLGAAFAFALTIGLLFWFMDYSYGQEELLRDKACQSLGMVSHEYFDGNSVCVDVFNEAHFAVIKCEGFWETTCTAKIITIGDLRVTIN